MPSKIGAQSAERDECGRFKAGGPGGPGRPQGSRNKASIDAAELLDGWAGRLTARAIKQAMNGDHVALRLCLERVLAPVRERPAPVPLPPVKTIEDAVQALAAVIAAAGDGSLTPSEAVKLAAALQVYARTHETGELERRLQELEQRAGPRP